MFGILTPWYEDKAKRKEIHDKGDVWDRTFGLRPHPNVRLWPGVAACMIRDGSVLSHNPLLGVTEAYDWMLVSELAAHTCVGVHTNVGL